MKPKSSLLRFLALAGSSLLAISSTHAADVTWDITPGTIGAGDSAITGGAGTWNDSNGNWTTDAGANNIAWSGTTETAVFGGTAGAVNLLSDVSVGGLTFNTTGYSITNTGANTLAFGSAGDIFTNTGVTATISSTLLTGSTGVTKTGAGTLIVSGSNNSSYNGAFTLSEGTLTLVPPTTGTTKSFGSVVLNGGILEYKVFSVNQSTTNFTVGGDTTIRINRSGTSSSQAVTYTLGTLSIGANTLSIDKATGGGSSTTFASTTLTGNAVFDIKAAFGGDGVTGPLNLGNLSDGGAGRTITKNGPGGALTWGTITLSGNHIWNVNEGTLTSGAITTAGNSLTKGGVGTLTLTGAFTGGGNVVLNGGTMNFANTTNTAGTLTLSASSTLGMGTGSTSFASSVADWDTPNVNLSLTGTLGPATTSLRFGTDATGLSANQLARTTYILASGAAKPVTLDASGYIRSTAYDGNWSATNNNWSDTGIWTSNIIADGQDSTLTTSALGSNTRTLTLDSNRSVGHIAVNAGSNGHAIFDSSGGSKLDLDVSSGTPTITALSRFAKITISADLTGDNGLETGFHTSSDPNGTIVLSGNNDYTGGTNLTYGTVLVGHANALSTGTITFGGGGLASNDATNYSLANTIALTGNVIIGKGNGSNPATGTGNLTFSNTADTALGATRTFTVDTGLKGTFAQAFSGDTFGITKAGNGTLELTGASTYTGTTTVSAGTLILSGSNNSAGTTSVTGGTLQLNSNSNGGLASGNFSPTGGTIQAIGADRTISNAISIGTGTPNFSGDYSITTGAVTSTGTGNRNFINNIVSGKTLTIGGFTISNRQVTFDGTGTTIIDGVVSTGTGGINKNGSGTLILNGSNSLGSASMINVGVVNIRNGGALGVAGKIANVTSGAALEIQGNITTPSISLNLNGTGISDGGALRNISGNNSLAGLITLQSASRINSDAGMLTVDVASGNAITGTFDLTFGGAGNTTVADNINISTGILTKDGSGTLTLSGTNTYTGDTLVSAGTLFVSGSLASDVTVSDAATVGGGGTVDDLVMGGGSLFDMFEAVTNSNSLAATTISFAAAGFGIDNLVYNGAAVDWGTISTGTYTLITGILDETNLGNFGLVNAASIGGGRIAYFQEGSLQLVVAVPEPGAALLGSLGFLLIFRRRRC